MRKYRSAAEMPGPAARPPLDPDNLRIALGLSAVANGMSRVRLTPGVRKYRSWDEALAGRDR